MGKSNEKNQKKKNNKVIKSNSVLEFDSENRLDFSERKDRFLVVTTIITGVIILLSYAIKLVFMNINEFYFEKETIFGVKEFFCSPNQLISVFLLTTLLLICWKFFKYCFFELKNLSNKKMKLEDEEKANSCYKDIFDSFLRYLMMFGLFAFGIVVIFYYSKTLIVLISLIGIFFVIIGLKNIKKLILYLINPDTLYILDQCIIFVFVYLIIFVVFLISTLSTNMIIDFIDKNIEVSFEGNNIPETINISVYDVNELYYQNEYKINDEFLNSFIEIMSYVDADKKDKTSSTSDNKYYRKIVLDMSKYYKQGKNSILIEFEDKNTNKTFRMRNDLLLEGEKVTLTRNKLEINY